MAGFGGFGAGGGNESVEEEAKRKKLALPTNESLNQRDNGAVAIISKALSAPQRELFSFLSGDGLVNPMSDKAKQYDPHKVLGLTGAAGLAADVFADPLGAFGAGKARSILKAGAKTKPKGMSGLIKLRKSTREGTKAATDISRNENLLGSATKARESDLTEALKGAHKKREKVLKPATLEVETRRVGKDGGITTGKSSVKIRNASQARAKIKQAPGATSVSKVVTGGKFKTAAIRSAKAGVQTAAKIDNAVDSAKVTREAAEAATKGGTRVTTAQKAAERQAKTPAKNVMPPPASLGDAMLQPRAAELPTTPTPETLARKEAEDAAAFEHVTDTAKDVNALSQQAAVSARQSQRATTPLQPAAERSTETAGALGEQVVRANNAAVRQAVTDHFPAQALATTKQAQARRAAVGAERDAELVGKSIPEMATKEAADQYGKVQALLNRAAEADKSTEFFVAGLKLNPFGSVKWGVAIEKGLITDVLRTRAAQGKQFEKLLVKTLDSETMQALGKLFRAKHGTRAGLLALFEGLNGMTHAQMQTKAADFAYNVAPGATKADFEEAGELATRLQGSDFVLGEDTVESVTARLAEAQAKLDSLEAAAGKRS